MSEWVKAWKGLRSMQGPRIAAERRSMKCIILLYGINWIWSELCCLDSSPYNFAVFFPYFILFIFFIFFTFCWMDGWMDNRICLCVILLTMHDCIVGVMNQNFVSFSFECVAHKFYWTKFSEVGPNVWNGGVVDWFGMEMGSCRGLMRTKIYNI